MADPRHHDFHIALADAVATGRVATNRHPTLPLTLYVYTVATQLHHDWDDVTETARGLVLDDNGNVAAWPLPKFHVHQHIADLPAGTPQVYEKADGSMLVAFRHDGDLVCCTKGSFESEQAVAGKLLLEQRYDTDVLEDDHTYVFEFIHPGNRIVVDYGDTTEVVLLAARDNTTGEELDGVDLEALAGRIGCRTAQRFDLADLSPAALAALDWENAEGFVLRYPDGRRAKVKFPTYVALHGIRTTVPTARSIWDALRRGVPVEDIVGNCPDEYYDWVREQVTDMHAKIDAIVEAVHTVYRMLELSPDRPRQQSAATVHGPWPGDVLDVIDRTCLLRKSAAGLLLRLLDGRSLDRDEKDRKGLPYGAARTLWESVMPDANVKPPAADLVGPLTD